MKHCIICGTLTKGSIGAAGYHWSMICSPCKANEDKALLARVTKEIKVFDKVFGSIYGQGKTESEIN